MSEQSKQSAYAIETLIPKSFIYEIGVYLQTCAHIEFMACALIACLNGPPPGTTEWHSTFSKLRKTPTAKLIKELRGVNIQAETQKIGDDLNSLVDWLQAYVGNRHIAAHGAFFSTPHGFLRVSYVHEKGTKKSPTYELERSPVTGQVVLEAVKDADRIYLCLLGMLDSIEIGLLAKVLSHAVPIVTHPSSAPK